MASEQVIANEAIGKAVAEVTWAAIKAVAAAMVERPHSMAGPKIGVPVLKQPNFNLEADDKYSELKSFGLEVNNILTPYNTPQTGAASHSKELVRQKRSAVHRVVNTYRKRYMQHIRRLIQNLDQQV